MKLNEIIELNGEEYTLELSRASFLQIDKICNVKKIIETLESDVYEYVDDIDDNYNPFENEISEEKINEEVSKKEESIKKLIERSLFVWLYPKYKFTISQVKDLLKDYLNLEDESNMQKYNDLLNKVLELITKCTSIKGDSKN